MDTDKFNDRGYKLLFSHPKMVEDLIKSFVKEEFTDKIDYTTLKPVKTTFVSSGFRGRETDVLWRLTIDEKEAYIYLLIDFQSTVDKFMSLRLMTYTGLFYEHLLKEKKKKKEKIPDKLPPVFPILLYNGKHKWSACLNISELIDISFPSLRKYIPYFNYYKIEETDFSKESLKKMRNLVSRMFLIELSEMDELIDIIEDTVKILKKEVSKELQRDFGLWIRGILYKKGVDIDISKLDEMEVRPMLLDTLDKFEKNIFKKGKKKGLEEGMRKGMKEGIEKGIEKGKIEAARKMLSAGIERKEIARILEIGENEF